MMSVFVEDPKAIPARRVESVGVGPTQRALSPGRAENQSAEGLVELQELLDTSPRANQLRETQERLQQSSSGEGGVVQRKMGYELEIPVTFLKPNRENVDTKMAYMNGEYFKVGGDKSPAAGKMEGRVDDEDVTYNPTILELVTHPIDEHSQGAEEKLRQQIQAIEAFRFGLELATGGYSEPATLGQLSGSQVELDSGDYADYLVNYPTATPRILSPESAYAHFTVGVSTEALPRAGRWVAERSVPDFPGEQTQEEASNLLLSPELFKQTIDNIEDFGGSKEAMDQLDSFLYLVFGQVRAIDRHENPATRVEKGGTMKNYAPMLSRASFRNVFNHLPKQIQAYIVKHRAKLRAILAGRLQAPELTPKAHQYLKEVFEQAVVPQSRYFGGMVSRPVERTGPNGSGLQGPPMEIRSLGVDLSEERIRQVVGEVFLASKSQFQDKNLKSPFALDLDYVFGRDEENAL